MTTFLDLKTRVGRRLIDAPAAVTAEVPILINDVIADLQRDHKFWEAKKTFATTTTEGSHILPTLPTDWGDFREQTSYYTTELGDSRRIVQTKSAQEIAIRWNNTVDIGEPRMILLQEGIPATASVFPLPDGNSDWSDGEYRIFIPYWSIVPALVADNATNWLTDLAATYIIAEATRQGFLLDWDEQRADVWATEAATQKRTLMLADKTKWLSGAEPMVPYLDVFEPKIPE